MYFNRTFFIPLAPNFPYVEFELVIPPTCHTTHVSYHPRVIPPTCHTTHVSYHPRIIPPTCHTTHVSYHPRVIPPTCHTTHVSYHPRVIPPTYHTTHVPHVKPLMRQRNNKPLTFAILPTDHHTQDDGPIRTDCIIYVLRSCFIAGSRYNRNYG